MSRYRFVAAEKGAARNVQRACTQLKVSRSAFYQWLTLSQSARAQEDAQLGERITCIHRESRGTPAYRACASSSGERASAAGGSVSRA